MSAFLNYTGSIVGCALLFFCQCTQSKSAQTIAPAPAKFADKPENIIFIIGDGMGLAQVSAGLIETRDRSAFSYFPVIGFHKSYSADHLVTDSAAGATAFSCGKKTDNEMIGVTPDSLPCPTLIETLYKQNWATGMVTSCSAPHATPAAFVAHQALRAFMEEIAIDFLKTPFDCVVAGGRNYFEERYDKKNLSDSLKNRGFEIKNGTSFPKTIAVNAKPFIQFTADFEPPSAVDGRTYLPDAVRYCSDFLKSRRKKGMFLMVEGSQIDWACHSNDDRWLRAEMRDFDRLLWEALDFANRDGKTLVVVTADHECGAASLAKGTKMGRPRVAFGSKLHTGPLIPVFAYGPGAQAFGGIYENTAIYDKLMAACQ